MNSGRTGWIHLLGLEGLELSWRPVQALTLCSSNMLTDDSTATAPDSIRYPTLTCSRFCSIQSLSRNSISGQNGTRYRPSSLDMATENEWRSSAGGRRQRNSNSQGVTCSGPLWLAARPPKRTSLLRTRIHIFGTACGSVWGDWRKLSSFPCNCSNAVETTPP